VVTRFYLCNHIPFDWTVLQHDVSSMLVILDVSEKMQNFTRCFSAFMSFTFSRINLVDSLMVLNIDVLGEMQTCTRGMFICEGYIPPNKSNRFFDGCGVV